MKPGLRDLAAKAVPIGSNGEQQMAPGQYVILNGQPVAVETASFLLLVDIRDHLQRIAEALGAPTPPDTEGEPDAGSDDTGTAEQG